jgi:hypothetical protein
MSPSSSSAKASRRVYTIEVAAIIIIEEVAKSLRVNADEVVAFAPVFSSAHDDVDDEDEDSEAVIVR